MRVNDKRIGKRRKREAKRGRMKQSIKANEGTRKENDESKVKVAVRRAKMQRKIMRDRQREIIKTGTQTESDERCCAEEESEQHTEYITKEKDKNINAVTRIHPQRVMSAITGIFALVYVIVFDDASGNDSLVWH